MRVAQDVVEFDNRIGGRVQLFGHALAATVRGEGGFGSSGA